MISFTEKDGAVTFSVRVQPRASRSRIIGEYNGALKIQLAAPPVDGEANQECVRFLAKLFRLSRNQIEIISGQTSRNKVIRICNISGEKFMERLSGI